MIDQTSMMLCSLNMSGGAGGPMMKVPDGGGAGGPTGVTGPVGLLGQVEQYLTFLHSFLQFG